MIRAQWRGFDESIASLLASLDEELPRGLAAGAGVIAEQARAEHPYTNRTGQLEQNTVAGQVTGSTSEGFVAQVLGDTEYGQYVEEGTSRSAPYPFLAPAAESAHAAAEAEVTDSMNRAAQRAGWKT